MNDLNANRPGGADQRKDLRAKSNREELVERIAHTDRIAGAIERLRHDFNKPLRIGSLSREIGMSPSSLHKQFKAVTAMSPLQFQKQISLQEARPKVLGDDRSKMAKAIRGDSRRFEP